MAKRDIFFDTKAGRTYLRVMAFLLIVLGLVLVVLGILLGIRGAKGFWQQLVMGVASIVAGVCQLLFLKKRKMQMTEPEPDTKPVAEAEPSPVPMAGEPDDVVVLDPTRPNEPDGAILVYRKEGVLVFDGKQIPIGKIVEGYVSNSNNNPYLPVAYHILLAMDDKNIVHIPAGQDFEWAQEALKQLQAAIAPQEEHRPYPRGAGLRMGPGGPETAAGGDCAPGIAPRPVAGRLTTKRPTASAQPD